MRRNDLLGAIPVLQRNIEQAAVRHGRDRGRHPGR
jgi:hypothetical protein